MNATTVAVDLAKNVFELAVADQHWKIVARHRLTRGQFERWFANRAVERVVMESCGSAPHGARWLTGRGIEVRLLPPRYVRPYVKRNKTDAADAAALLEALRCGDIAPVRIKSVEQQALQSLHRIRSLWLSTRTARINALRGFCREFGLTISGGSCRGVAQIAAMVADPDSAIPSLLRPALGLLIEEIRLLEGRIGQLEAQLTATARQSPACATLLSVPGVGLLTATAMLAATGGTVAHFKSARHFSAWLGLTPRESSSGTTRRLGGISKRGDRYLRTLLVHGARSVLWAARGAHRTARPLDGLRQWVLALQTRRHHNTAACALANKLARICYATLRDREPFDGARLHRKIARQSFVLSA